MKPREPDHLTAAYTAAWASRCDLGDDSLQILYTAMHRADLDPLLQIDNPVLAFTTRRWERGASPERFERDLRRHALIIYAKVVKNAVVATAGAVRTIMRAGAPSPYWREEPEFGEAIAEGYCRSPRSTLRGPRAGGPPRPVGNGRGEGGGHRR